MKNAVLLLYTAMVLGSVTAPPAALGGPLFYAVVGDTQKSDNDPFAEFAQAVEHVNTAEPDLVLMPGDLTNTGSTNQYEHFMAVAKTFSAPVLYVLGNHEAPAGEAIYQQRFTQYTGQPPYLHRVINGWHVFLLNSVSFTDGKLDHEGAVSEDQLDWLKGELSGVPKTAPIILTQHPPSHFPACQTANEDDVLDLFADHDLLYTLTGHKHYNHVSRDAEGILHLVTGSMSFSCKPKTVGIGYRFISTAGRDLWTAWVPLTENTPLTTIGTAVPDTDVTIPAGTPDSGAVCLRLPCSGKAGTLVVTGGGTQTQPTTDDAAMKVTLRDDGEPGTLFLPLDPEVLKTTSGTVRFSCPEDMISGPATLVRSTVPWTHHRLGHDTAPAPTISMRTPQADTVVPRGNSIPIVAVVENITRRTRLTLEINGQATTPDGTGLAVVSFAANGLQSQSHKFKNHLYVNDQFVTAIAPNRNVTKWERFAYVIPQQLCKPERPLSFKITAGTPNDGTGANPKENNEDYQAKDLVAWVDGKVVQDPALPIGRAKTIGDNSPKTQTFLACTPSVPAPLSRWSLLVHNLDTSQLPEGPADLLIRAGQAEHRMRIVVK